MDHVKRVTPMQLYLNPLIRAWTTDDSFVLLVGGALFFT